MKCGTVSFINLTDQTAVVTVNGDLFNRLVIFPSEMPFPQSIRGNANHMTPDDIDSCLKAQYNLSAAYAVRYYDDDCGCFFGTNAEVSIKLEETGVNIRGRISTDISKTQQKLNSHFVVCIHGEAFNVFDIQGILLSSCSR